MSSGGGFVVILEIVVIVEEEILLPLATLLPAGRGVLYCAGGLPAGFCTAAGEKDELASSAAAAETRRRDLVSIVCMEKTTQ